MTTILNLTQHNASPAQVEAGVVEPAEKQIIKDLLTFEEIPSFKEMYERAVTLAQIAKKSGCAAAMIGGAPFFMSALEEEIYKVEVQPLYAFSKRRSVDVPQSDGSVRKQVVFDHLGFVPDVPM